MKRENKRENKIKSTINDLDILYSYTLLIDHIPYSTQVFAQVAT